MIIFNLEFLSTLLALIGIIGWSWVWCFSRYKTGCDIRIQLGILALGVAWLLFFLADIAQHAELTVIGRAAILFGLWCCMPLLKLKRKKL